jgi:ABC-type transporter Mla subunit MlaD
MSTTPNNFKIGMFTLVGLLMLTAGLLVFGARGYFEKTSMFETYVEGDVTGLGIGSAVELRGVRVGKVTGINFSWNEYQETQPSYVVVEFEMRDDVTPLPPGVARSEMLKSAVKRGLRARLKAQGITGTSILSVEYLNPDDNPAAQVPWIPRHTYIPAAPGQLSELLESVQKVLRNVDRLDFEGINQLLQGDLKSVGQILGKVDEVDFGGLGTNANALIKHTDQTVDKMQLEKLSRDLDGLVAQLQASVATLQPGLANFDFDTLNQTLVNAKRATREMDDVLFELKQYPSGFLFGKPPEKLNVAQPPPKQ